MPILANEVPSQASTPDLAPTSIPEGTATRQISYGARPAATGDLRRSFGVVMEAIHISPEELRFIPPPQRGTGRHNPQQI